MFIFGRFIKRTSVEPRIISSAQLYTLDVRIGDLIPVIGGCPRVPGDRCDLVASRDSIVCEYKGELYYKIIG